jgi:hypothetical protein
MNSRDADYEEALKQLIESTRPESERYGDGPSDKEEYQQDEPGVIIEIVSGARKKRKQNSAEEKVGQERMEG